MYATDFEFDGQFLSDYNCIVCSFNSSYGVEFVSVGSFITFNKVHLNNGKTNLLAGVQYDECITASFDICKNPNGFDDNTYFSSDECRDIIRWLNRKEFCKFRVVYDDIEVDNFYLNASFNVEKIKISDKVFGLRLTLETDSPWAYGDENKYTFTVTDNMLESEFKVLDTSDDIGDTYVSMEVVCASSGDLTITNETLDTRTYIRNCSIGEKITIDGNILSIQTSLSRNILDSFNYEFPQITNSINNRWNVFKFSLSCDVTITYRPIIKEFI